MNNLLVAYYFLTLIGLPLICDGLSISFTSRRQNGRTTYIYNGKEYATQEEVLEQIKRENPGVIFKTPDSFSNQNNNGGYNRNNGYNTYNSNGVDKNAQSFNGNSVDDFVGNTGYSSEVHRQIWGNYEDLGNEINKYSPMKKKLLEESNKYREHHGAPPLTIDSELETKAQNYAEKLASTGNFAHDPKNDVDETGENLGFGSALKVAATVVKLWYDENKYYDYASGQYSSKVGHFTQLVWKASTKAGFGVAKGSNGFYVVCKYKPRGNIIGYFKDNVLNPK
uniref:CAP domain-containing protein (inferred by orthology to a human protein) n=1 Tax=Strongyloides venezuelensis TaxID=75913 RepID=A0A0K0FUY9_STRVS